MAFLTGGCRNIIPSPPILPTIVLHPPWSGLQNSTVFCKHSAEGRECSPSLLRNPLQPGASTCISHRCKVYSRRFISSHTLQTSLQQQAENPFGISQCHLCQSAFGFGTSCDFHLAQRIVLEKPTSGGTNSFRIL